LGYAQGWYGTRLWRSLEDTLDRDGAGLFVNAFSTILVYG
jgi:hypothetical protein